MKSLKLDELIKMTGGRLVFGDKDISVDNVQVDSRDCKSGSLFVPIIGEKTDGHDYIEAAHQNGANVTLIMREDISFVGGVTYILVENTRAALQSLGRAHREQVNIPIVGITGSVGKTTTKEMAAIALGSSLRVIKTKGNWNSQVGLPRMMLELSKDFDAAVIEMGMSLKGEMNRLAHIAAPQTALITNIGVSHIGNLGSRENIMREKLSVINGFEDGGYLLLNGDDDMLQRVVKGENISVTEETAAALKKAKIETYGTGAQCTYRIENVTDDGQITEFDFLYDGKTEHVVLNTLGNHYVSNAAASLALALHFGISVPGAVEALKTFAPSGMRGESIEKDGMIIINDAYNASPDSMKSGMEHLMHTRGSRHIAVLADVLELGEMSKECHTAVGHMVADLAPDVLVTIGYEAENIAKGALDKKINAQVKSFYENGEALEWLKGSLQKGDVVLFKGSRGMHLEEIVNGIIC